MEQSNANTLVASVPAARKLHSSPATLSTWRSLGKGPKYVKIGGRVFYRLGDLDAFIDASVVDPAHTAA